MARRPRHVGPRTGTGRRGGRLRARSTGHITTQSLGVVEGQADLQEVFDQLTDAAVGQVLKKTVHAAMKPVQIQARANARKFKGHKDDADGHWGKTSYSGQKVKFPKGFTARQVKRASFLSPRKNKAHGIVTVTAEAFYSLSFVERGHRDMKGKPVKAQPWLVPALEAKKQAVIDELSEHMNKAINSAVKTRERRAERLSRR